LEKFNVPRNRKTYPLNWTEYNNGATLFLSDLRGDLDLFLRALNSRQMKQRKKTKEGKKTLFAFRVFKAQHKTTKQI